MSYLIQQCATQDCPASIRFAVGQSGLPTCKWCQSGTSYYTVQQTTGELWPWQTDAERERRLRMPHNQALVARHYPERAKGTKNDQAA